MIKTEVTNVLDTYNMIVGAVVTVLSAIFGSHWYLFAAFLLLNVMDWLTGWYKSRKLKQESSSVGLVGIVKKLGYWVIIAVAFLMAYIFQMMGQDIFKIDLSFLLLLGWFTLACLLINEIRSILENLVECGYNVPNILIRGLAVTEKLLSNTEDAVMPPGDGEKDTESNVTSEDVENMKNAINEIEKEDGIK